MQHCPTCLSTNLEPVELDHTELTDTTAFAVVVTGNRCLDCGAVDEASFEETELREDHLLFERLLHGESLPMAVAA